MTPMTTTDPRTPPLLPPGYEFVAADGTRAGLGEAYRVRRTGDDTPLLLTVLDAGVSADARFVSYFLAVVERLRHINQPSIVPVVEHGQDAGRAWVVARAPAGRTIRAILDDGTLDPQRAIDLLEPLGRALRTAAEFGLRHRDLDAGNVLVSADDRALLLEPAFIDPLAVPGARDARPDLLTYIPPERLRQAPPDDRSDVHLLGGLLLTALTGRPPGSEAERILRDRERDGAVPPELDLVIWRALAADPLQRPASPRDLFHQARRALGGEAPERFIRRPQPAVAGEVSSSTDLVRWGAPGLMTSTARGPQRLVTRISSSLSGWSTSAGRVVREAGGGISGFFSRLRPGGSRTGLAETDRPAPTPAGARARPVGELEAPSDDGDPHPAGPAARTPADSRGAAAGSATDADAAARIGAAAERLRQTAPAPQATAAPPASPAAAPWSAPGEAPEPEPAQEWPLTDPSVRLRRERARRRRSLLIGLAAAGALVAGTVIVLATGGDDEATQQAPAAQETRQGPITLTHPARWQTVDPAPPVLGVRLEDPVALEPRGVPGFVPGSATLVAGRFARTDATLLPPGLADRLEAAPRGEPIQVGDLQGYRYRGLARPEEAGTVDLYVFRTAEGTFAVSCFAGEEVSRAYLRQCGAIAGTLRVEGATPVPVGGSAAYGRAVRTTMAELNRSRSGLRTRLRAARTPQGQARLSDRLASVYRTAAGRLASVTTPAATADENEQLVRTMRLVANSYDRLAAAARADNRAAFNRARVQVRRRENLLDARLRTLQAEGYELG